MQKNDLKKISKIDLHCHLDGSLSLECISSLLNRKVNSDEIMVADDCKDLATYLEKFQLPLQCLQTYENIKKASENFLISLINENIKYIEVRFAPMLSINNNLNCKQVIEAVLDGLNEGKKVSNIDYNVIVCAMRHHSDETNIAMIDAARYFLNEGVCAADLAGDEARYPMYKFRNLFTYVKSLGFPFTIHAGECGDANNIKEAILLGAKRIGHGIAMKNNKDIQELCRKNDVTIEMCPISNMQTKAVKNIIEYPLREFLDNNIKVTINTDNITVSNTSLSKEFGFIQNNLGIRDEEIELLIKNSINSTFADDSVKHKLLKLYS